MKHHRAWISLFTACALLAQTLALARALPMSPMNLDSVKAQTHAAQDQTLPCHSGAATSTASVDVIQNDALPPANCCGTNLCDCTALCGAGPALATSAVLPAWVPAAGSAVTAVVATAIPPYTLTPLRPPIASQN